MRYRKEKVLPQSVIGVKNDCRGDGNDDDDGSSGRDEEVEASSKGNNFGSKWIDGGGKFQWELCCAYLYAAKTRTANGWMNRYIDGSVEGWMDGWILVSDPRSTLIFLV
mmetsp:Transcript_22794/g.48230  ORF Transcript_22794/g.48230 Transcript_22794/m.48230 type:complete len:109 (-) Transcript_22794:48-374(-)